MEFVDTSIKNKNSESGELLEEVDARSRFKLHAGALRLADGVLYINMIIKHCVRVFTGS
jgi:hypothetical protein